MKWFLGCLAPLVLAALLWMVVTLELLWPRVPRHLRLALVAVLPFALGLYAAYVIDGARAGVSGYRVLLRSFYGQLAVEDGGISGTDSSRRTLVHGGIIHGTQWREAGRRRWPRSARRRPAACSSGSPPAADWSP